MIVSGIPSGRIEGVRRFMRVVRFVVITLALVLVCASTAAAQSFPRVGSFMIDRHKDAMSDEDRSSVSTGDVIGSDTLLLSWVCLPDGLNVRFWWGRYLSGDTDTTIRVQMRFDSGTPSDPFPWDLATGQKAAFIPMEFVNGVTKYALASKTATVRVKDGRDFETLTGTFDLGGLRQALATLPCAGGVR